MHINANLCVVSVIETGRDIARLGGALYSAPVDLKVHENKVKVALIKRRKNEKNVITLTTLGG